MLGYSNARIESREVPERVGRLVILGKWLVINPFFESNWTAFCTIMPCHHISYFRACIKTSIRLTINQPWYLIVTSVYIFTTEVGKFVNIKGRGIRLFWNSHTTCLRWADIPNKVQFRKAKIFASKATEIKEKSKMSL